MQDLPKATAREVRGEQRGAGGLSGSMLSQHMPSAVGNVPDEMALQHCSLSIWTSGNTSPVWPPHRTHTFLSRLSRGKCDSPVQLSGAQGARPRALSRPRPHSEGGREAAAC